MVNESKLIKILKTTDKMGIEIGIETGDTDTFYVITDNMMVKIDSHNSDSRVWLTCNKYLNIDGQIAPTAKRFPGILRLLTNCSEDTKAEKTQYLKNIKYGKSNIMLNIFYADGDYRAYQQRYIDVFDTDARFMLTPFGGGLRVLCGTDNATTGFVMPFKDKLLQQDMVTLLGCK